MILHRIALKVHAKRSQERYNPSQLSRDRLVSYVSICTLLQRLAPSWTRARRKYTWVDAFRTSLSSNSREIADLLKRLAELDLAA